MKKKISIVGMFLLLCIAFVAGINMTGNNVQALTPPRVTPTAIPDYYFASYDNAHEFVAWFKSSDAKTGNNGVFAQMINSHEEYGYLLVPYYEDAANSVSVSANAIGKGKFLYYSKNPAYSIKVEPLYDVQDKKYDALGIVQYIKDKCTISDFSSEYKPSGIHFRPGEATHTYLFAERIYKVGGERTECIAYRDTSYNAYTKDVIDYSLGIVFIKNGMRVTISYDKRISGESIISSLNTLKFKEEVLNQANYEKTKAEIKNGPGGASSVDDEDDKEESADENNEIEYKIIGKTKVACGSTYKYKAKLTGINGKVKWSVNKKKLARISKDGKLKALKKGTVTVTAKVKGVSCSIKVKIVGKDMMSDNETATAKTTTIKLEQGDTCKIKIKKNSKIKLGRKKIVKVSNKGVMKALKVGKCTVTVKKGKKTWKYNVVVRKKKQPEEIGATPSPTPERAIVGGCMAQNGFLVDRIEAKDELLSYVYLVDDPSIEHSYMPKDPGIKYVRIEVYTETLKNIKVGDSVWFVKHVNDKVEISGDTCIYVERVMISLMQSNTPTPAPTEKPVLAADSWLNFKLNSDSIWLNDRYISGTTENIGGGDGIIEIKVGSTIIASKELKADETEFSIPVDFSECKEGDKVIITYSGIGGDLKVSEGDDYIVEHMRWPAKHEYTLKKGTTCALIRKEFKILQDEITTETKCLTYKTDVIGESLNYYIKIDDERVKAEQYVTDNGVFDLQVDFSSYEPGTEIVVGISSYGYRTDKGTHFEECNVGFSEKIFILGEAKNETDEVVE